MYIVSAEYEQHEDDSENCTMLPLNYLRLVCNDSEFNTSTTLQLCTVVDSYNWVKAVDNTSDIYIALEKIATNTVKFYVAFHYVHLQKGIIKMSVTLINQLISA